MGTSTPLAGRSREAGWGLGALIRCAGYLGAHDTSGAEENAKDKVRFSRG